MKPKISIPSRHRTPEQQVRYEHTFMINDLYVRWINNQLVRGDEFLVIQHLTELENIKSQSEWRIKFEQDKLDWKCQQMQQDLENSQKGT